MKEASNPPPDNHHNNNNNNNNVNMNNNSSGSMDNSSGVSGAYLRQLCILRAVKCTLLAPFDRVKYVMQTQGEMRRLGTLRVELRTTADCVRHLMQLEGARSFWRGNIVQVVSVLPIALAHLFIGPPAQELFWNLCPVGHSALLYTLRDYIAYMGAAAAVGIVTYPLDFVRFRLAVDLKAYKGAPYEFKHAMNFFSHPVLNDCPHYLYRGLGLFILGSILFGSVRSVLLDWVGPYLPPEDLHRPGGDWRAALLHTSVGLSVAAIGTLCLHPVDLIRRRLMVAVTEDRLRYQSAWDCASRIAKREGLKGFYRGWGITLIRLVVGNGLLLCGLP